RSPAVQSARRMMPPATMLSAPVKANIHQPRLTLSIWSRVQEPGLKGLVIIMERVLSLCDFADNDGDRWRTHHACAYPYGGPLVASPRAKELRSRYCWT